MKARWLPIIPCYLMFCCCATTQCERRDCSLENWYPSGSQWQKAARNAVTHPGTWVPATSAMIIAAGGWDADISDWAVDERSVFGSHQAAHDASDILRSSTHIGMVMTALAVPSDDQPWLLSMAWRMAWEHLGVMAASYATDPIKRWTDRDRPNGGSRSFPSWHATRSAAYAGLGYRNLDLIDMKPGYRHSAQLALAALATGTAWARVEAGQHYPTDVLAGAALGNFIAVLVHDAFLGRDERAEFSLRTNADKSLILRFEVRF
jgi:membrane-associated phospholipid phosphatase